VLITAATAAPITLEQAKVHLKVDGSDEDVYIQSIIDTCTALAEQYTQRSFMQAIWELQLDDWYECNTLHQLDRCPLVSVDSIKYFDENNAEVTLPTSDYEVYNRRVPGFYRFIETLPKVYDRLDVIRVRYTAGYGQVDDSIAAQQASIPAPIKSAILLLVGHLYENRQDEQVGTIVTKLTKNSEWLLHPYRLYL
jgi:uncharacterized phiE125 gp8 family phage protein